MNTTAHKPYAKFGEDDIRPILGYQEGSGVPNKLIPLVPSGDGRLVKASVVNGYNSEYEIIVLEDTKKQLLHG